ncbi:hypothetical protein BDV28DRAFT_145391 [Aspergillus coremiiformis]|uniref:NAD(P)-binding protein n=1 Tax=Aspergillus coremiiformis TaxID=138285 RepID=A0A5N6ZH05_9EURO|nr:hypothetical protein BDV28DRAFT_145391 [Aspergillus coremiiformis]
MAPTVAFITGANRGLGLGLVKGFITKPDYEPIQIVIAAVRDPAHPTAQQLTQLPAAEGSKVLVVQYDASIEQSAFDAVEAASAQGIDHLDYVVANAGICTGYPLVKDVQRADIVQHVEANVLSAVSLYQATRDLLQKSTIEPVFAIMGSGTGALGRQPPVAIAAYGASKSMINWYGVRINAEDKWLNTFVLDPGWVQTDMGNSAARAWGLDSPPVTVEVSTGGMVDVIVQGTKEQYGGRVVSYDGVVQEW